MTLGDDLGKTLREAYERVLDQPYHAQPIVLTPTSAEQYREIRKAQAYVPVSCCVMTDATGEDHCDHPPPPQPSRRQRLRWAIRRRWSGLRMRVGTWIAGVDPDEWDD